jgi:hypothetical protein
MCPPSGVEQSLRKVLKLRLFFAIFLFALFPVAVGTLALLQKPAQCNELANVEFWADQTSKLIPSIDLDRFAVCSVATEQHPPPL